MYYNTTHQHKTVSSYCSYYSKFLTGGGVIQHAWNMAYRFGYQSQFELNLREAREAVNELVGHIEVSI